MGKAAKRRRRKGPGNEEVARMKQERSFLANLVRGFLERGAFKKRIPPRRGEEGSSTWLARDEASGTEVLFTRNADRSYQGEIVRRGVFGLPDRRSLPGWLLDDLNDVLEPPHAVEERENPFAAEPGDGYADPAP